jgi:hypothetical protein
VVVDQEETAALKLREAGKVPVVCRYWTNSADEVEERFRAAFSETRTKFLGTVEAAFNRKKLGEPGLAGAKFQKLIASFQKQNKAFPVTTNVAVLWASGQSDRVLQSSLSTILREAMARPIRGGKPPVKFSYSARLLAMGDNKQPFTLEDADRFGFNVLRTNIATLARAKEELTQSVPAEELVTARFLASLMKTNCSPDPELTRQAQERRIAPLYAADRYEPGQLIVKQGEVIDRKMKAALEQIAEKTALVQVQLQQQPSRSAQATVGTDRGLWIAAGAGGMAFVALLFWVARRRQTTTLLPARVPGTALQSTTVACPSCAEEIVITAPIPRPQEFSPRARLMLVRIFQRLLLQRETLRSTQDEAAAEISRLEERLKKVQAPLEDRLRAYEQRIGELQRELAQKGDENRELINAKIELARQQIEIEKSRMELN